MWRKVPPPESLGPDERTTWHRRRPSRLALLECCGKRRPPGRHEDASVADHRNLFNPDSQERTLDQRRRTRRAHLVIDEETGGLAKQPKSDRLRIINTPMGQELIVELNSFEVDFTSAGNMRGDVRSRDHQVAP
jgi:hypothetical protein